jgi:hypothetical protein
LSPEGFEPSLMPWKGTVLPLDEGDIIKKLVLLYFNAVLIILLFIKFFETGGFEPPHVGFKVQCLTSLATSQKAIKYLEIS